MNASKRMTLMVAWLALSLGACKLTPDMPTSHCEIPTNFNGLQMDLQSLRSEHTSHTALMKKEPKQGALFLKSYLLHHELNAAPFVTDRWLIDKGLPAFESPRSLREADAQLKALEFVSPMVKVSLGLHEAECIEATEHNQERAVCAAMKRDFDSFSRLCSRMTGLLLRYEAGEWTTIPQESFIKNVLVTLFRKDLAVALRAVERVHPELSKFTRFEFSWDYDTLSGAEFSQAYREALQRLVLVVSMAGAITPSDCGPIAVQCSR